MSILSKTANKQPEASEDHLDTDRLCSTCPSREHCVQVNPACWDVPESYRRLFENAIEGIFRTTPDGYYISVSPSLVKLYGYESANDLITSLTDINHQLYVEPNRRSEFCRLLDQQGYIQNFESQVYRKDGAIIWISENAWVVRDAQGSVQHYEGTVIDITEKKLRQVTQAQLQELETLCLIKDDFLGTVSHELRAPIANIKMAIHLLEIVLEKNGYFSADPLIARYFQILKSECQHEKQLINNLLDLARLEAQPYSSDLTLLDFTFWIPHIVEPFLERAEQQQQTLQLNVVNNLPLFETNAGDLGRILTELLQNACKYTPSGETIQVSAWATSDEICLQVCNSGVEISAKHLPHIFEKGSLF
jgi:Amt family ammonium transporter